MESAKERSEKRKTPARTGMQKQKCRDIVLGIGVTAVRGRVVDADGRVREKRASNKGRH